MNYNCRVGVVPALTAGGVLDAFRSRWTLSIPGRPDLPLGSAFTQVNAVRKAVACGYAPSVRRAALGLAGASTRQVRGNAALILENGIEQLLKDLSQLGSRFGAANYDCWAHKMADSLLDEFRNKAGIKTFNYGHAQKWIALSIKYLLSSGFAAQNPWLDALFDFGYCPIDRKVFELAEQMFGLKPPSNSWHQINNWADIQDYQHELSRRAQQNGFISAMLWEIIVW